jgi:sulfite exporter TauE/SafE
MHVDSAAAALFAGLGTGAHCALMCGPMACAFQVRPFSYHLGRLLSYGFAGALCGLLGNAGRLVFHSPFARIAPWVLLLVLVLMALGVDRRIPAPAFVFRAAQRIRLKRSLGWLSPLIPCGPLWLMLGVAVTTGAAGEGALLLLCFAAGTVFVYAPLLAGWSRVQVSCGAERVGRMRTFLVWAAVALMAWRLSNPTSNGCCGL